MAKKGKMKISKVKRNNQTTNKMKKQGKLKLQRHRMKLQKHGQPEKTQVEYSSESDSASGDEWADMLDEEEQQYIMSRLAKQPQLLATVPEEEAKTTGKKRKRQSKERPRRKPAVGSDSGAESDASADIEDKYEKELAERPAKKLRPLLPIKTKQGLMERTEEVEDTDSEQDDKGPHIESAQAESGSDSGVEGTEEEGGAPEGGVPESETPEGEVVTAVELLAARRDRLQHEKLRIGALCSSLLESPEKKLKNLYPILYLMEERLKDGALNLHSVRKLAMVSAFEVFRDILPDYPIRHQDYSNVKLKKDTLAMYKYEKELLEFYKRYLQRLEKAVMALRRKKGDTRKADTGTLSVAVVSVRCLCGLLTAKPYSNYASGVARCLVPLLACGDHATRGHVADACRQLFAEDRKGEVTLTVVRLIGQLAKRLGERLPLSALACLQPLAARAQDLDATDNIRHKRKQDEKHKKRIINLSKKEKKRAKKLKEVERELLETEAQESELARRKQLTEMTKAVLHIYFRLLKSQPPPALLAAVLDGLIKFAHVMNVEYYSELVGVLGALAARAPDARGRLLCARAALAAARAAPALQLDAARFVSLIYADCLTAHAGANADHVRLVVECMCEATGGARRVSGGVLRALAKRLGTLAAQLPHHAALACLALVQRLAQQSKDVSSLVESDSSGGAGRYLAELSSPEHCNAAAARLAELCALRAHHHPAVRAAAAALLARAPPPPAAKRTATPMQIFDEYDGSQMSFKPAIPPPKRGSTSARVHGQAHTWAQPSFKDLCQSVEDNVHLTFETKPCSF